MAIPVAPERPPAVHIADGSSFKAAYAAAATSSTNASRAAEGQSGDEVEVRAFQTRFSILSQVHLLLADLGRCTGETWVLARTSGISPASSPTPQAGRVESPMAANVREDLVSAEDFEASFVPVTDIARELWALRQAAVQQGMRLMDNDELDRFLDEQRGRSRADG